MNWQTICGFIRDSGRCYSHRGLDKILTYPEEQKLYTFIAETKRAQASHTSLTGRICTHVEETQKGPVASEYWGTLKNHPNF